MIDGLDIPEIGIPIEVNNDNHDHEYAKDPDFVLMDVSDKEHLNNTDVHTKQIPNQLHQKAVRPPLRVPNRKKSLNPNKAAFDLVSATEKTNEIKEKYYNEKLNLLKEMHKENLKLKNEYIELKKEELILKREQINVAEKLSTRLDTLISNIC